MCFSEVSALHSLARCLSSVKQVSIAAVDLGASSGRVIAARVGPGSLSISEANRFANGPVRFGTSLRWDVPGLVRGMLEGLRLAKLGLGQLDGAAIDSWALDYGALDANGALLADPFCYRDDRTVGVMAKAFAVVPRPELYDRTGIQFLPFNTIYQLMAEAETQQAEVTDRVLLIPDLLSYLLTGVQSADITNASTTQLLDARTGRWALDLARRVGIPPAWLPPLCGPGELLGHVRRAVLADAGIAGPVPLFTVASHDTASAVVATPAADERFAYISCGTWSLVGVELDCPVVSDESLRLNFTNEVGIDGSVHFLRNVMGLWLLQECIKAWQMAGFRVDLESLIRDAAAELPLRAVFDPDNPIFLTPGDMPTRIAPVCGASRQPVPHTPPAMVRAIIESLSLAHRRTLRAALSVSGRDVNTLHLVGGGARNELLCQLTADACALPVVAGPVEAAAIGNLLVQARALGALEGGLADLRALVRRTHVLRRYEPREGVCDWTHAEDRIPWVVGSR
jgi:rhamnulokinase